MAKIAILGFGTVGSGVIKHASVRELQHCLHLDADGIAAAAKEILHEKDPA